MSLTQFKTGIDWNFKIVSGMIVINVWFRWNTSLTLNTHVSKP